MAAVCKSERVCQWKEAKISRKQQTTFRREVPIHDAVVVELQVLQSHRCGHKPSRFENTKRVGFRRWSGEKEIQAGREWVLPTEAV